MGTGGNQLGVGETLVFERTYLAVVGDDGSAVPSVLPLTIAGFPGVVAGDIDLQVANSRVLKPIPIMSFLPEFNKSSESTINTNFEFDTQIILIPLVEFVSTVRVVRQPIIANTFLRLTFEGVGSILAPRVTL